VKWFLVKPTNYQDLKMDFLIQFENSSRGFALGTFLDLNNNVCTIQDSSLATSEAIWLGAKGPENTRMLLNVDHVAALIEVLQRFVETGSVRV
jgi:hypothetical protein